MAPNEDPGLGWNRLEERLLATRVGDTVSVATLTGDTGLARETVERVLEELTRTELFERKGDGIFARRSLWQTAALDRRRYDRGSLPM